MMEAIVVGDNCIDCYGGEVREHYPGGNALNVAVYLQRLGLATGYVGIIGDDAAGDYLRQALEVEGLDLRGLSVLPGATGTTFIEVREGERYFVAEELGVQVPLRLSAEQLALISGCRLAHFTGFTSWQGGAAHCQPDLARELHTLTDGPRLSLDFSVGADGEALFQEVGSTLAYSFFSRDDLDNEAVAAFIRTASEITSGMVVVTRGGRGSAAARSGEQVVFCPAPPGQLVDTLGAGDSFIAGFLAASLRGSSPRDALRSASSLAASVIGQKGAWSNRVVEQHKHLPV